MTSLAMGLGLGLSRAGSAAGGGGGVVDIWGRPYEEALIDPAPSSQRTTYEFSDQKLVLAAAEIDWVTNSANGPYWPWTLLKSAGQLPADYPVDIMIYYSSDHSTGAGGIAVVAGRVDAESETGFDLKTYNAALSAGWFDTITTKPAASPLFQLTARQIETPCVFWDEPSGTWYCYFQDLSAGVTEGTPSNRDRTRMVTSSNGLTWSSIFSSPISLVRDRAVTMGDGHTGYFRFHNNPFAALPYDYIGYSLHGGTARSGAAQWGADSPSGPWTYLGQLSLVNGFMEQTFGAGQYGKFINMCPRSVRKTRFGYVGLMEVGPTAAEGGNPTSSFWEVILSEDGRTVLGGSLVFGPQASTFSSLLVRNPNMVDDVPSDRRLLFYIGYNGTVGAIGMASGPLRNPGNTYLEKTAPVRTAPTLVVDQSFMGLSELPAGWETDLAGVGSAPTYTANGMEFSVEGGEANVRGIHSTTPLIAGGSTYLDIFFELQSLNVDDNFRIHAGFFQQRNVLHQNGVRASTGSSTVAGRDTEAQVQRSTGGTFQTTTIPSNTGIHRGSGSGGRRYRIGCRFYPAIGRVAWLQMDGENEIGWAVDTGRPSNFLTEPCFASFSVRSISGTNSVALRNIRIRQG